MKKMGTDPVNSISQQEEEEFPEIQKVSSSGLTKILSATHKGYISCTKFFYARFKLPKGDGKTGIGDTVSFCELFSSVQVSLNYRTQVKGLSLRRCHLHIWMHSGVPTSPNHVVFGSRTRTAS